MGKFIKKFSNDSARVEYEGSENYLEPYVSYVEGDNTVHYNKFKAILVATYNVEDTSNPTPLFIGAESAGFPASAIYDKIEIDGAEIDMSDLSSEEQEGATIYSYGFEIDGQHTVKYTLKDPTLIGVEFDEETHMPSKIGAMFVSCPITSVEIPNSFTSIGNNAFNNCRGLTSVTIPDSVTNIDAGAFFRCDSLTSVTIPSGVTSIGESAFQYCSGLTSVTIGSGITSIGDYAFIDCSGLTSVTSLATTAPTLGVFVFNRNASGRKIYVPSASVNAYKAAINWSTYAADIEAIQ